MNKSTSIASFVLTTFTISTQAGLPNAHTWPMEHIMISMNGSNLEAHANTGVSNPIEMLQFSGEMYDGNASSLNEQFYSDQYGWVLDGIVDPGFGNSIWIEMTHQSQGLTTYEGGRRMMIGVQTFDPIFGTDGSETNWQWNGMMTHNWYSADTLGEFEASYRIYIGDSQGNAITSFGEAVVTLNFSAVPAPASLSLLGMGTLIATRRRRA
ncbi:MAG: PEP-CTERM sorting domain-containing protein [Phycisphaerales bacterium]|nr:PEP-CTERM sorting domain-containing protein [Phycisphaerales bacterium]